MHPLDDTIAAIASPPGGAARGIVRTSGPAAWDVVEPLFRANASRGFSAIVRPTAIVGILHLPGIVSPLPCEVYLWPEGRSYTGQPVAEIHTLGSPPLVEAVLRTVCAAGARLAEPGEFTLRAFLGGRIDLTQAEAVLGVIDAAGPQQLTAALAQLAGGLAGPLQRLRDKLLDLLAHLEAGFDFADEDLPFVAPEELDWQLGEAAQEVARLEKQMASRGEASTAIRVVLAGSPNVGKSSLFNALVGQRGAIVSEQPGTTRDYLTAELDLDGVKCQLIDTAGIEARGEATAGDIGRAAQAVAAEQRRGAKVRIFCLDATRPLTDWEQEELARTAEREEVVVLTKIDAEMLPRGAVGGTGRLSASDDAARASSCPCHPGAVRTSAVSREGIADLRRALRAAALTAAASPTEVVAGTAFRCRDSVRLAAEGLHRARQMASTGGGEELIALEIRAALDELGKVVGAVYTDDVLERVFSRFCVGK